MSDVTNHLCQLLQDRDAMGQKKYGTSLDRTDLTAEQWIQHTIEELLDAAGYLEALKRKLVPQSPPKPPIAETITGLRELFADSPQWTHDCDKCQFLGRWQNCDLYFADHGGLPNTLIARFGNEGEQYTSGLGFVGFDPAITEAHRRAVERGLVASPESPEQV